MPILSSAESLPSLPHHWMAYSSASWGLTGLVCSMVSSTVDASGSCPIPCPKVPVVTLFCPDCLTPVTLGDPRAISGFPSPCHSMQNSLRQPSNISSVIVLLPRHDTATRTQGWMQGFPRSWQHSSSLFRDFTTQVGVQGTQIYTLPLLFLWFPSPVLSERGLPFLSWGNGPSIKKFLCCLYAVASYKYNTAGIERAELL